MILTCDKLTSLNRSVPRNMVGKTVNFSDSIVIAKAEYCKILLPFRDMKKNPI